MPEKTLDTFYYHDHFMEMLTHISELSGGLLDDEHRAFIGDFRSLSRDAQCLYIRMANRRKQAFLPADLSYEEISDTEAGLGLLRESGFTRPLDQGDYSALLSALTKPELQNLASECELTGILKSWPKARILEAVQAQVTPDAMTPYFSARGYVVQAREEALSYLLYLYFGHLQLDLKQFTMRDLGLMRVNQAAAYSPRFTELEEAQQCFRLSQLRVAFKSEPKDSEMWAQWPQTLLEFIPDSDTPLYPSVQRLLDKALSELGKKLEHAGLPEQALSVYRACTLPKAQERYLRLLYASDASDDKEETRKALEAVITRRNNDALYHFAEDFYNRKFAAKRLGSHTEALRASETLTLDDAHRGSPEQGVMEYYTQKGWQVWFSENTLWRQLFALVFWQELFEDERSLQSPFDRIPANLRDRSFTTTFTDVITQKLEQIHAGQFVMPLLKVATAKHGQPNGLFRWGQLRLDALQLLLNAQYGQATSEILRLMAEDYPAMKDGFPDVLLAKDGELRLIEVKAEGDALRQNQLTRHKQLQQAGFACDLLRVAYAYDPNQTFVVVDIETTGGKKEGHRITEIGAVKIRGGEVIDRYQTLLNPQRHIPSMITRLTGISDDMVADAPLFSDIADEFELFSKDAIFVAHNVNFDYGFMQMEYERLGRFYRRPKYCTVVNMRRHFPGLDSYKLSSLCHTFEVSLDTHHRALCDAEAATQLLLIILQKRQQEG